MLHFMCIYILIIVFAVSDYENNKYLLLFKHTTVPNSFYILLYAQYSELWCGHFVSFWQVFVVFKTFALPERK